MKSATLFHDLLAYKKYSTIEELNKRTLGKLSIIETGIKQRIEIEKQVSSIRSEEQELLSMIPSTEETPTEVQTLKLTK